MLYEYLIKKLTDFVVKGIIILLIYKEGLIMEAIEIFVDLLARFFAISIYPIIIIFLVIEILAGIMAYNRSKDLEKNIDSKSEKKFKKDYYDKAARWYLAFTTLITIFPLLGMLGTVTALYSIDITGGAGIPQNEFFKALGTTILGIVLSVIFKCVNIFIESDIEAQLTKASRMLEKLYE